MAIKKIKINGVDHKIDLKAPDFIIPECILKITANGIHNIKTYENIEVDSTSTGE